MIPEQDPFIFCVLQPEIIPVFRAEGHLIALHSRDSAQDRTEIHTLLRVRETILDLQQIRSSDKLIHTSDPQPRHDLPQLSGDKQHKVFNIFRFTGETLPELRILRRNAHGTCV